MDRRTADNRLLLPAAALIVAVTLSLAFLGEKFSAMYRYNQWPKAQAELIGVHRGTAAAQDGGMVKTVNRVYRFTNAGDGNLKALRGPNVAGKWLQGSFQVGQKVQVAYDPRPFPGSMRVPKARVMAAADLKATDWSVFPVLGLLAAALGWLLLEVRHQKRQEIEPAVGEATWD